jgi:hypothetical protein
MTLATTDAALAAAARDADRAAQEALGWLDGARATLREEAGGMAREFRRFGRRARRLEAAAERPMCVAVFGPSQSGKSYLISALARRGTEPVTALFEGRALDFVREINPEGGQEATGLVTRFTLRPPATPPGFPVALRLLSQTDVLKILGNAFLEDFDPAEVTLPEPAALAAQLGALAARAAPGPLDRLSEDDVEELREYFEGSFRGHPLVPALGAAFWNQAASLAPRLAAADRAALFAPLWNGHAAFTDAARTLLGALSQLGDPAEAFAGIDALIPRESSIIDVRTLAGLGEAAATLPVATRDGRRATLPRGVLAALVAELTVALRDRPWDFFDVTDLLDFPGARSREKLTDPARFLAQPGKFPGLFLRGKVAYLWQRYVAEQEITAMLLCIGPSNQEVRTLPRMVKDWLDTTLGTTPEDRARHRNPLFLVLTKFDTEFEEKKGAAEGTGSRWSIRLAASLLDFFGKEHGWPREWAPGRPFDNTLWLRNPNVGAKHILDYDEEGREAAIRPSEAARIARLRAEFVGNEEARRHFADPARAWDAAMALNDGGIAHLAEQLRPVCDPALKRAQVAARLGDLKGEMARRLQPFWHSGDLAAEIAKRREAARAVSRALVAAAAAQGFGRILRALEVPPETLSSAWWRMQTEPADAAPLGVRAQEEEYLAELGDLVAPGDAAAAAPRDEAARFAAIAVAEWLEGMNRALLAPDAAGYLRLPRDAAATLAEEMAAAARRLDLAGRLAQRLRDASAYRQKLADSAARPVLVASLLLNGFVATLGFADLPEAARPRAGRDQHPVFAARPLVNGAPVLGAEPASYDKLMHVDWITAFVRLVEENAASGSGQAVDIAANERLGAVLRALAA